MIESAPTLATTEVRTSVEPSAVGLTGRRAVAVVFSGYPSDPRPRRAAEAMAREGMSVDVICLTESENDQRKDSFGGVKITRIPLKRRRGGRVTYVLQYGWFIIAAATILASRACRQRYDLVHIHNMPDALVFSALIPKLLGAKIVLDLHDPMPELMMSIFDLSPDSLSVRLLRRIEQWSIRFADAALTPNTAFKKLFVSRGCPAEKLQVVMNTPDERIFTYRPRSDSESRTEMAPYVIMYHGALVERHGLDVAIQALQLVLDSVPNAELRICGAATPFLDRMLGYAKELGVEKAVKYLGVKKLEEIVEEIDRSDVGIIPNRHSVFTEINMPTRIFEYLSRGKPVIAPGTTGIRDYFAEDELFFFEAGSSESLAAQLQNVYVLGPKAGETVKRGQSVYQEHQWEDERSRLIEIAAKLVE